MERILKAEEQKQRIEQDNQKAADTVVNFPRDRADEQAADQDKLHNSLGFLFPQNKIMTSGLPMAFNADKGAQMVQMAAVKRGDDVADVFVMVCVADSTQSKGYRERVIPMNGFRPEAAEAYIQRMAMMEEGFEIPHKVATADDRMAALELRAILLTTLN